MSDQRNRDRDGAPGRSGGESWSPAGTPGGQGQGDRPQDHTDASQPPARRPNRLDEDEDSGLLGNRTGLR